MKSITEIMHRLAERKFNLMKEIIDFAKSRTDEDLVDGLGHDPYIDRFIKKEMQKRFG